MQKHTLEVTLQYGKRILHVLHYETTNRKTNDLLGLVMSLFAKKL